MSSKYLGVAQRAMNGITHKTWNNFNHKPLSTLKVISATSDGSLHYKWKVNESHLNRTGKLHGGLMAGIIKSINLFTIIIIIIIIYYY